MKLGRGVAATRHRGARIQPAGVCRDHEFLLRLAFSEASTHGPGASRSGCVVHNQGTPLLLPLKKCQITSKLLRIA